MLIFLHSIEYQPGTITLETDPKVPTDGDGRGGEGERREKREWKGGGRWGWEGGKEKGEEGVEKMRNKGGGREGSREGGSSW